MKRYIVLLRGVMPTGKNKVPMARLREVLASDGFKNIRTYIQSGNAVIDTDRSSSEIEQRVRDLIKKYFGPDLVVVVRTPGQLQNILKENPFQKEFDISRVFFVLFATPPSPEKIIDSHGVR